MLVDRWHLYARADASIGSQVNDVFELVFREKTGHRVEIAEVAFDDFDLRDLADPLRVSPFESWVVVVVEVVQAHDRTVVLLREDLREMTSDESCTASNKGRHVCVSELLSSQS